MRLTQDQSFKGESDTQSLQDSQFDQLNMARIQDEPPTISSFLSPQRKKRICKTKIDSESSEEENDWRTSVTKTIYEQTPKQKLQQTKSRLKRKYPAQKKNIKLGTVTVNIKNKQQARFENVCAICLEQYSNLRGLLQCGHKFCFECIEQWIKTSTNCPCCRAKFKEYVRITINNRGFQTLRQIIQVEQKQMKFNQLDYWVCYQCNRGDDEDVLLICDLCDFYCCHVYCDPTLNNRFPSADWYCKNCKQTLQNNQRQNRQNRRTQALTRTQSLLNNIQSLRNPQTQASRTLTLNQTARQYQSDSDESQFGSQNIRRKNNRRQSQQIIERTTRSKAYEILNSMRPNNPRNRLPQVIERITSSTAINLRNLRRRR